MPKTDKTVIKNFIESLKDNWPKDMTEALERLEQLMPDKKRGRKSAKENIATFTDTSIFESNGIEDYSLMPEFLTILGEDNDSVVRCVICLTEMGLLNGDSWESTRLFLAQYIDVCVDRTFRNSMARYIPKSNNKLTERTYTEEQKIKDKQLIRDAMEEMRYSIEEYSRDYISEYCSDYFDCY